MQRLGLGLIFVSFAFQVACSSGHSGGNANQNVSDKIIGELTPDIGSLRNDPAAEQELQSWHDECAAIDGYNVPNFKEGLHFVTREDEIDLWPSLSPEASVRTVEAIIEKILNPKEFLSIQTYFNSQYSIQARYKHEGGNGGEGFELIDVLATNPPNLKEKLETNTDPRDETYITCSQSYPDGSPITLIKSFATFRLRDGTEVRGIAEYQKSEVVNYHCGLINPKTGAVLREVKITDRAMDERIEFYSKELVNPFRSQCHSSAGLLRIFKQTDLSGSLGIFKLDKEEVLSVSH